MKAFASFCILSSTFAVLALVALSVLSADMTRYRSVECSVLSPDGEILAMATPSGGWGDYEVWLWSVRTGALKEVLSTPGRGYPSLAFSGDGRLLAIGDQDKQVTVWELEESRGSGRLIAACKSTGSTDIPHFMRWVAISNKLRVAAAGGKQLEFWDVATGQTLQVENSTTEVSLLQMSPREGVMASGDWAGSVTIWELKTLDSQGLEFATGKPVESLTISPDETLLTVACTGEDSVTVLDLTRRGTICATLKADAPIGYTAFSPDGSRVAIRAGGMVRQFSTTTWEQLSMLEDGGWQHQPMAFNSDGELVIASAIDITRVSSESRYKVDLQWPQARAAKVFLVGFLLWGLFFWWIIRKIHGATAWTV